MEYETQQNTECVCRTWNDRVEGSLHVAAILLTDDLTDDSNARTPRAKERAKEKRISKTRNR